MRDGRGGAARRRFGGAITLTQSHTPLSSRQQCVYLFGQGTQPLLHASALGPLLRSHPGAPPGDALEAACEAIRALWRAPPRPPPLVHRDEGWLLPEAAAPRPALVNAFSRRSADAARTAGAVALAAAAG